MVIGPNMPGRALEILFRSVKNGLFLHPGSESSLLNCVGVNRLAHILFALVDDPLSDHKNTFQFNDCILWKDIVSEFAVALGKPITRVRIPLFLARLAVLMTHNKIEAEKLTALANQTCFEDDTPLLLNNKMDLPETLDDLCNYIKTLLA
jgi:hypothetical protein